MTDQVLVRDLPFGDMEGDKYPPPLNTEICNSDNSCCHCRLRIVLPNNSPSPLLPSNNPSKSIDFFVCKSEEILRAIYIKFFICPRISRSGLVVIKLQEEKLEIED